MTRRLVRDYVVTGLLGLALIAVSLSAQAPSRPSAVAFAAGLTRPSTLGLAASQSGGTVTMTASWDANPAADAVVVYRLYYGVAPATYTFTPIDTTAPATSTPIPGLVPGTRYYFALQARAAVLLSALSTEVSAVAPQIVDATCTPPLGANAIAIFPTAIQRTGSGGAGSKARLDFQIGSPNSPITSIQIQSNSVSLAAMTGTDLGALAGMWFGTPTTSGTYPLSVQASNAHGCVQVTATSFSVSVP